MKQGTPEWLEARCGMVTASRIADVMAKGRNGKPGAGRANYLAEKVAEHLTGISQESMRTTAPMQWGINHEDEARRTYGFITGSEIEEIGFVIHPTITRSGASIRPTITRSGASPDGLVGKNGLVEIKCPNTATHIATVIRGVNIEKYTKQIQWQLACTERRWCDFISYDPRLPFEMSLFVKRIMRDDAVIAELEKEVKEFLNEVDRTIHELKKATEKTK